MKILVIIVSYNFERWIDRCLSSLRQSEHPVDVLVVDNCSQDHSVEMIEERYPEVRLVRSDVNLGFGRANNIGLQIALREGYEAVFLLNQDAWIEPKTVGTLAALARKHPEYGILSPVHLTGQGDNLDYGFATYTSQQSPSTLPKKELVSVPFVNAAFWLIPTDVLRKVGGFSPLFRHYGEDKDYVNRVRHHGYLVGYSPDVSGCHDRAHRQPTRKARLYSTRVYLLSEYANINYSWGKAFARAVLAGGKKALQALLKGDVADAVCYCGMSLRLLWQSAAILRIRKITRRYFPNFIQS